MLSRTSIRGFLRVTMAGYLGMTTSTGLRIATIPFSVPLQVHKFDEFLEALTPTRLQLLKLSKDGNRSIAELAVASKRDSRAVSKDIAKLVGLGLLSVVVEGHAGQRRR